jgi:Zn-dependent protease
MRTDGQGGLRLGSVRGIELRVDWSLAFIFFLISFNLGAGLFPLQHPGWSSLMRWAVALVAAALFFASVLAHELSHALVARRLGIPVHGITLFIFGGVARIGGEPPSARAELLMAGVGPLTSLVIGAASIALGLLIAGTAGATDPAAFVARLGPLSTILLWLGPINVLLALFNLLPGFPLDGGRVLRAILWSASGDLVKATRWASIAGRVVALTLVFIGALMLFGQRVPFFGGGIVSGLWLILIGWFLHSGAMASQQQVVARETLRGVPVARLMRQGGIATAPSMTLDEAAERFLEARDARCLPVLDGPRLVGMVCTGDLRRVPRAQWPQQTVAGVMTPADRIAVVTPAEPMADALDKLAARGFDQIPVVEEGTLRGFLRRADVLRWLELRTV